MYKTWSILKKAYFIFQNANTNGHVNYELWIERSLNFAEVQNIIACIRWNNGIHKYFLMVFIEKLQDSSEKLKLILAIFQ